MSNINNQINELEAKLGINLPVDFRKFLQSKAKDQLIGKYFYDCLYKTNFSMVWPVTITRIFEIDQLLKTKKEEIVAGHLHIGSADDREICIGLNENNSGKIFSCKWKGFQENFIDPSDVNYYLVEDIFSYEVIADNFVDFSHNLLPKLPNIYKGTGLSREKIKEIKKLEGTARMQYLISLALAS